MENQAADKNKNDTEKWVQVDSQEHYSPLTYLTPWRMASIGYQFRYVNEYFKRGHVLEIGPGNGLTTQMLRELGHKVTTLDVDERLNPDISAPITEIPKEDDFFDCFLCSQVLEHIPWPMVDTALSELSRTSKAGGVLSVPTNQPTWLVMKYDSRSWGTRRLKLGHRRNKPLRHKNGEHHWELEANVSSTDFEQKISKAGFNILKKIQPVECMYHQFFVLEKK